MCYTVYQSSDAIKLENRFNAEFKQRDFIPKGMISAFVKKDTPFPKLPVITNAALDSIELFEWGLMPNWAKDKSSRNYTLNARIETIAEKPSFKASVSRRCLILVDGFFEYEWLDKEGKKKQLWRMTSIDNQPFALGGLWNIWTDKKTGEVLPSFTILTMEANEKMAKIHNSKKRMPLALSRNSEKNWLMGLNIMPADIHYHCEKC